MADGRRWFPPGGVVVGPVGGVGGGHGATRGLVTSVPLLVKRTSGSSTRLPMMVVWLSAWSPGSSAGRLGRPVDALAATLDATGDRTSTTPLALAASPPVPLPGSEVGRLP
jgi:hypothetical protein